MSSTSLIESLEERCILLCQEYRLEILLTIVPFLKTCFFLLNIFFSLCIMLMYSALEHVHYLSLGQYLF
jgi:hypothetical protein